MTANLRRAAEAMRRERDPFRFAVSGWLDFVADVHEDDPGDYCAGRGHSMDPRLVVPCNSWWCHNVAQAIAVAGAYLGEDGAP